MILHSTMPGGRYNLSDAAEKQKKNESTLQISQFNGERETNRQLVKRDTVCGVGSCKPVGMNCLTTLKSFVIFYSIMSIFTQSNTAYMSSQITSIEKQFQLSSTVSGTLLSCNEIGQLAVVLVISHLGHNGHIPRIISISSIIYSIAMLATTLPNYIQPYSLPKDPIIRNTSEINTNNRYCSTINNTVESSSTKLDEPSPSVMWALYIIGASIAIQGLGKAPRRSLSATYVDNNVADRTKTGVYLGTTVAASILGPPLAILIGSGVSSIPADLSETLLTKKDPRWIGAWWLGFIGFGIVGIIVSIPICLFPKKITGAGPQPGGNQLANKEDVTCCNTLKELPLSLLRVFKRPIFTLTLLAICCINFSITGIVFFGPKYLVYQFDLPAWKANLLHGTSHLVVAMIGTFSGGWMTTRYKMGKVTSIKFILVINTLACIFNTSLIFAGCDDQTIVGLDKAVEKSELIPNKLSCYCDTQAFIPVCDDNQQTYLNPCVAECWNKTESGYDRCSQLTGGSVSTGLCDAKCFTNFVIFMVLSLLQSLMGTQAIMPNYLLIMRSVEERDKSMAVGLLVFATSLLGWLPAPIIYGAVIDGTCRLWEDTGGSRGSCQIYFLEKLRVRFLGLEAGLKFCSLLIFGFVFYLSIREARHEKKSKQIEKLTETDLNESSMELKQTS